MANTRLKRGPVAYGVDVILISIRKKAVMSARLIKKGSKKDFRHASQAFPLADGSKANKRPSLKMQCSGKSLSLDFLKIRTL